MSSRPSDDDEIMNREVTVIYQDDSEDPFHKNRKKMTLREAYSEIDSSRQYNFCAKCGHDINEHAPTIDYVTKYAGKCQRSDCNCVQYYFSGIVKTEKELEKEKVSPY